MDACECACHALCSSESAAAEDSEEQDLPLMADVRRVSLEMRSEHNDPSSSFSEGMSMSAMVAMLSEARYITDHVQYMSHVVSSFQL